MRLLLTGGTGLLGWAILQRFPPHWECYVTVHRNALPALPATIIPIAVDLTDPAQIQHLVETVRPEVIVHTASVGDLDIGQERQAEAWQINVEGTRHLLMASRPFNPYVIYCSTIYVFDGEHPPYREEDMPCPINFYGRTKLAAEHIAQELCPQLLILRPTTTYGWHLPMQRANWVTWLLKRLAQGQPVNVVNDVANNHLWVGDLVATVLAGVERRYCGIVHVGGLDTHTRYEFSLCIADIFGYEQNLLSPVDSNYFPTIAPRPRHAICALTRLVNDLGIQPLSAVAGLRRMLSERQASTRE